MIFKKMKYSHFRERKTCRTTIFRMIEKQNITLEELKKLHQQKRIYLFKGHQKQLDAMILEKRDAEILIEDDQRMPSFYKRAIRRTLDREDCTLEQLLERKNLNRNAKKEIQKMIFEQEQNVKEEEKMISTSAKPLVVACKLTDNITHLIHVDLKTNKESLLLSNRTICGEIVTKENVKNFSNKANCKICLKKEAG